MRFVREGLSDGRSGVKDIPDGFEHSPPYSIEVYWLWRLSGCLPGVAEGDDCRVRR